MRMLRPLVLALLLVFPPAAALAAEPAAPPPNPNDAAAVEAAKAGVRRGVASEGKGHSPAVQEALSHLNAQEAPRAASPAAAKPPAKPAPKAPSASSKKAIYGDIFIYK